MTYSDLAKLTVEWFKHDETRFDQLAENDAGLSLKLNQLLSNQLLILKGLSDMADNLANAAAELTADAGIIAAATTAIDALLASEAALQTQLAAATDPAGQQALTDAATKAAAARAALQAELDKANAGSGTGTGTGSGSGSGSASGSGSGSA